MQKIISLFQRNYDGDRLVRNEVVPGAEWVTAGEGDATRKYDGSCCMVRKGLLYKRYELRRGKKAPAGFEPAQEPDPVTGAAPGWILIGMGPTFPAPSTACAPTSLPPISRASSGITPMAAWSRSRPAISGCPATKPRQRPKRRESDATASSGLWRPKLQRQEHAV